MMTSLIVGASGATGRLLVEQLLARGQNVKVVVRSPEKLPEVVKTYNNLSIIHASVLDLSDTEMAQHVNGCDAVASCLGHNMNLKGLYGQPCRLVTDATSRLCSAIKSNRTEKPIKFVLMSTTAISNRDIQESNSIGHNFVIGLLRLLLPPHVDNEKAADYLRIQIGHNNGAIEWAAVRPSGLIDENDVSEYEEYSSPIGSAIFDSGQISRINVGHFMADLITDDDKWNKWKGQMPVLYNKAFSS